jgi:hypothetical protein
VEDSLEFRVGVSERDHIVVQPRRRKSPGPEDFYDGNWVDATIHIAAGGFHGQVDSVLRSEEFVSFRDQLRPLYVTLTGRATFETCEGWLRIQVEGGGKGHFHADCEATDQPGTGNRLVFKIDFDQTELPAILRGLDAICDAIPVIGRPIVRKP